MIRSTALFAVLSLLSPITRALRASSSTTRRTTTATASRKLQQQSIFGYTPQTQITDVAAIELDQMALEDILVINTFDAMQESLSIYINGAHSQSYAILSLAQPLDPSLDVTLQAGTLVVGPSVSGNPVRGYLLNSVTAGATQILVAYKTNDNQANYVGCQVGANPNPNTNGCKYKRKKKELWWC